MRDLLADALDTLWMVCTAPLRRLLADALRDVHTDSPALHWQAPRLDPEPLIWGAVPDTALPDLGIAPTAPE